MYIHKTYSINNQQKDIKEYKKELKELSKINLRRSSKFNILALLGSLTCMKDQIFSDNLGIYVASEYGSITSVKKVLEQVSQNEIVMPFDFLNINSNNVSFYVSQALNANGKNMVLTAHDLSFEKALELALFELETKVDDILVGSVDESLEDIKNYNNCISNTQNLISKDTSSWLYINQKKEGSLCKIEKIKSFENIQKLNNALIDINIDLINLNQYAKKHLENLNIEKEKIFISQNQNIHSACEMIEFLSSSSRNKLHLALDKENKAYLIEFTE